MPAAAATAGRRGRRGRRRRLDAAGDLILIDEMLTPDSSRFWPADDLRAGPRPGQLRQAVRARLSGSDQVEQGAPGSGPAARGGRKDPREILGGRAAPDDLGSGAAPTWRGWRRPSARQSRRARPLKPVAIPREGRSRSTGPGSSIREIRHLFTPRASAASACVHPRSTTERVEPVRERQPGTHESDLGLGQSEELREVSLEATRTPPVHRASVDSCTRAFAEAVERRASPERWPFHEAPLPKLPHEVTLQRCGDAPLPVEGAVIRDLGYATLALFGAGDFGPGRVGDRAGLEPGKEAAQRDAHLRRQRRKSVGSRAARSGG